MKKSMTSEKSQTDWQRLQAMKDEDIDLSDSPEVMPEMLARAVVRRGLKSAPAELDDLSYDELKELADYGF